MMNRQITPPDIKLLSAYLDGQLTPREGESLETRLSNEPDLQAAVTELARTRNLLRSAPRLRVPRNFTLTPEMVGERRGIGLRLYPAFRLASAIASLLFVAVVVGDFFVGRARFATGLDQAAPQVALLQEKEVARQENVVEAPAAEMVEIAAEEMPVEVAEELGLDAAAPEAFVLEAEVETAPVVEAEDTEDLNDIIDDEPPPFTLGADEPVAGIVESMKAVEEQAGAGEEAPPMEGAPVQEDVATGVCVESLGAENRTAEWETVVSTEQAPFDLAKDEEVGESSQEDVVAPLAAEDGSAGRTTPHAPEPEPAPRGRPQWSFLRIVEILLAILALGTGGLAYYLRRRT